jgi:hypothetical protein
LLISFLISLPAHAADVAFLEAHDQNGKILELEPGGRFFHVAIRVGDQWLHAHPKGGVRLVSDLSPYGDAMTILRDNSVADPQLARFMSWLGKPFDFAFSWSNSQATYCTRLVAELLDVPPQTMHYSSETWKMHAFRNDGAPGLSPDDLYRALWRRGYRPVKWKDLNCARRLEKAS